MDRTTFKLVGHVRELYNLVRGDSCEARWVLPSLNDLDCTGVEYPMGFSLHPDHNGIGITLRQFHSGCFGVHISIPDGTSLFNVMFQGSELCGDGVILAKDLGFWLLAEGGRGLPDVFAHILANPLVGTITRKMDAILFTTGDPMPSKWVLIKSL